MTLVAGVDSSTQSCKVVVVDADTGAVRRMGRALHPEGTEVDPAAWWEALCAAIADAGGLGDVSAISVAAQQHGLVALDAEGRVIRPALLWNDTRSAEAATTLREEVGARAFAARVGVVPVASMTLAKLRWLSDAEPENAARVAAVALPHDWLTWRLRGFGPRGESPLGPVLEELTTDASDASGTAYFSAARGAYDLDLLELGFHRRDIVLPRVLAAGAQAGETAEIPGDAPPDAGAAPLIPPGVIVGPGAGDNAGAALGLGAQAGDVVVSIGTSGTVFAVTDTPAHDASGTVAGFADASGRFLPLIATLNAARVLSVTAGLLDTNHAGLDRLALTASPGADGLVLLPYFAGERTPNLPGAQASLHGLSMTSTTRENLARAAVEGLLCGLADGLDAVCGTGVRPERILLIGGGAASRAVRAIAAQVFVAPVGIPAPGEYVAVGAAVQAAWALTGARPDWPPELEEQRTADPHPIIREQYRHYAPPAPVITFATPE